MRSDIRVCRVPAALRPCLFCLLERSTHTLSNRTDALLLYRSCNCHYFPRGEFESLKVSYFQREREEEIATNGG